MQKVTTLRTVSTGKGVSVEEMNKSVKARKSIGDVKSAIEVSQADEIAFARLQKLIKEAKDMQSCFENEVEQVRNVIKSLESMVEDLYKNVGSKLANRIKEMEKMENDLGDFLQAKTTLKEELTRLSGSASDPDVIQKENQLPDYDKTFYSKVIKQPMIELPNLDTELNDVGLTQTTKMSDVKCKLEKIKEELHVGDKKHTLYGRVNQPQRVDTITTESNIYGLTVDTDNQRIITRRQDAKAPICVYNYMGERLHVLGGNIKGIASTYYQNIALDTKRQLYLVPLANGCLITMDTVGIVMDTIKLSSKALYGVTYSKNDFYVVSSVGLAVNNKVYKIDPETKLRTHTFSVNFNYPYNVCGGAFSTGSRTISAIAISDHFNHCIKVLDSSGNLLKTYGLEGKKGSGETQFENPFSMCTDPGGRLLIVDQKNRRLVSVRLDEGEADRKTILDKETLRSDAEVQQICCDPITRRLFVGYQNGTIDVFPGHVTAICLRHYNILTTNVCFITV